MSVKHNNLAILLWGGCFVGIGLIGYLILKPYSGNGALSFWIGAAGGFASLYGLVVMLVQFQSVRKTAEATKDKVYSVTTVSELSHYAGLLRDASSDIERGSLELARYKIQAAKDVIISKYCGSSDEDESVKKKAREFIVLMNNHISSLSNAILENGVPAINKQVIVADLEKVSDFLQEMKNKQMKSI